MVYKILSVFFFFFLLSRLPEIFFLILWQGTLLLPIGFALFSHHAVPRVEKICTSTRYNHKFIVQSRDQRLEGSDTALARSVPQFGPNESKY